MFGRHLEQCFTLSQISVARFVFVLAPKSTIKSHLCFSSADSGKLADFLTRGDMRNLNGMNTMRPTLSEL